MKFFWALSRLLGRFGFALSINRKPIYEGRENGWARIGWERGRIRLRKVRL